MADAILHIKDSYYFAVPKLLWRSDREKIEEFPNFWVRLDPNYQMWEAARIYDGLQGVAHGLDEHGWAELRDQYQAWRHADHHNLGKPFDRFLTEAPGTEWFATQLQPTLEVEERTAQGTLVTKTVANENYNAELAAKWPQILAEAENMHAYADQAHWSDAKIEAYNSQLDGKILIPQPFGELRNLYQSESGFAISKFMIVEFVVAILIAAFFIFVAARLRKGGAPRGKFLNAMEAMLLYMRDEIARPAIGAHDAHRFVPLLWTIFFFVLGCNLMGMVPWVGAPTGSFAVTLTMAAVILLTTLASGMIKLGPVGFWKNQVPSMGLWWPLALILVPMIFVLEVGGMLIRHGVLGVRLLANMVAGHLVLLGVLALAFSVQGAASEMWELTAVIAILASTAFSLLELFVCFLQAYVFTFLSALFIGAAIHRH